MRQTELWIGGKFVAPSSGEYFDDINPSDQKAFARVAKGTSADKGIASFALAQSIPMNVRSRGIVAFGDRRHAVHGVVSHQLGDEMGHTTYARSSGNISRLVRRRVEGT